MNNYFQPKGEKAKWEILYDDFKSLNVGDVITHKQIGEILEGTIEANRSAVYRAAKELLKEQNKYLECIRGKGYKVIDGLDIMEYADGRHTKAKRQIKKAAFELKNIATVQLTPEEKKRLQDFMSFNANIKMAFSSHVNRIEKAAQVVQVAQAFTESEISKLRSLIG